MVSTRVHLFQCPSNTHLDTFVEDAVNIFTSLMPEGTALIRLLGTCVRIATFTDPLAIALTGNDISLLPLLVRAMISGLVLTPGMSDTYGAYAGEKLVGYLIFSKPGQLLFST